jgi:hypothetical protein
MRPINWHPQQSAACTTDGPSLEIRESAFEIGGLKMTAFLLTWFGISVVLGLLFAPGMAERN